MPLPRDVAVHAAQRRRAFDRLAAAAAAVWAATNIDDFDGFLTRVSPIVTAATSAQAAIGSAWIARQLGDRVEAPDLPYERLRNGVPFGTVYRRPLLEVRRRLAAGSDFDRALRIGGERLQVIAQSDAQAAYSQRVFDLLRRRRTVNRYRRVVSGPTACSRCVTAAGQLLPTDQILPRHPACRCSVLPIIDADPGPLVADESDAPEIDVDVVEHDELGPTLVDADHQFTPMGAVAR